jgi:hypothetical protein
MNKQSGTNASTRRVERVLCEEYFPNHPEASITAYQYNSASIRVRIIDPAFKRKSIVSRDRGAPNHSQTARPHSGSNHDAPLVDTGRKREIHAQCRVQ